MATDSQAATLERGKAKYTLTILREFFLWHWQKLNEPQLLLLQENALGSDGARVQNSSVWSM